MRPEPSATFTCPFKKKNKWIYMRKESSLNENRNQNNHKLERKWKVHTVSGYIVNVH